MAIDGEKPLQQIALGLIESGVGAQFCLFQETFGDFARGAAAERGDAGDFQQILDQSAGARLVGAVQRQLPLEKIGPEILKLTNLNQGDS